VNNSIDLQITSVPSGVWNGGGNPNFNWSVAANWRGTALSGTDPLDFTGSTGLNNTNDTASETAQSILFDSTAGAFALYGNPITLAGDISNISANVETINLGQTLTSTLTNFGFSGATSGLTVNGSLTGSAVSNAMQQIIATGNGAINGVLSSGANVDAGLRINVTNNSDTPALKLGGNNTSTFGGQLFVSRGVMNYGSVTEAPTMNITRVTGANIGEFMTVGDDGSGIATFNMANGSLTLNDGQNGAGSTSVRVALANVGNSTNSAQAANWNQTGGTVTLQGFDVGTSPGVFGANQPGTTAAFNISGGTFNAGDAPVMPAVRGTGSLNISGTGVFNSTGTGTNISGIVTGITVNDDRAVAGNLQSVGTLNLNSGGTLTATSIRMTADRGGVSVNANVNFNGGTWTFNANGANLFATGTNGGIVVSGANYTGNDILAVTVQSGGAVINNNGFTGAINMPMSHDSTLVTAPDGGLSLSGSGSLTLNGINTYNGNTTVNAGTLALAGSASIGSSTNIIIAGGATFDVSGLSSTFALGSGQVVSNSSSTANIAGNLDASVGTLSLTYASGTPSLSSGNGTLTLAATTALKIKNTGPALAAGTYTIIANGTGGTVAGTVPSSFIVNGGGIAGGTTASLQISGGALNLVVASSALPPPPKIQHITISGGNIIITGTNNNGAGGTYRVLTSTNVALAATNWTLLGSGSFDSNGNFSFTNATGTNPRQFYLLQVP
jgi:autotransporter-associated beta strand protein